MSAACVPCELTFDTVQELVDHVSSTDHGQTNWEEA